jgi:hypothetical protein
VRTSGFLEADGAVSVEGRNLGGRPKRLARYVRELVRDDGRRVADYAQAGGCIHQLGIDHVFGIGDDTIRVLDEPPDLFPLVVRRGRNQRAPASRQVLLETGDAIAVDAPREHQDLVRHR